MRLRSATRQEGVAVAEQAPEGAGIVPGEGFSLASADGDLLGWAGRLDPSRVDAPAWAGPVFGLEITLPAEPKSRPAALFHPLPPYPGVDRDLALLLPRNLPASRVEEVIGKAAGPLLVRLDIFDLYEGKGIPAGFRSVAFRLRFQSDQRTLTDQDVERSVNSVIDHLREELGVEKRG
jgi:phenylalanyl-tRNA synthetase beta chain